MSLWTKVRNAVVAVARPVAAAYTGGASELVYRAYEQKKAAEAQAAAMASAQPTFPSAGYFPTASSMPTMYAGGTPGFYGGGGVVRTAGSIPRLPAPGGGGGRLPAPGRAPMPKPGSGYSGPGVNPTDIVNLGRVLVSGRRTGKRRRRQNPMNVKALRRAIRRVKAFKRIETQVNRLLPVRRVAGRRGGSPGVITRSEALRALRT